MTIVVTGGAGFIGSNFIFYMKKQHLDVRVVCIDKLTCAENLSMLKSVMDDKNFRFCKVCICDRDVVCRIFEEEKPDAVVNFAAESHVDRSIDTSSPYASSKAGADLLVLSYYRTCGLPVTVSRCSNNYGPCHFPEKLIPLMIANALNDKPLPETRLEDGIKKMIRRYLDNRPWREEILSDGYQNFYKKMYGNREAVG